METVTCWRNCILTRSWGVNVCSTVYLLGSRRIKVWFAWYCHENVLISTLHLISKGNCDMNMAGRLPACVIDVGTG
jgi:hypothetical protein